MNFLVNAFPKPMEVATSDFAGAYVTWRGRYCTIFCETMTKSQGQKWKSGFAENSAHSRDTT